MSVTIEPWAERDRALLTRLLGDPAMMVHLGGPETEEQLDARQARYLSIEHGCFRITDDDTGEGVGWVGYWSREWHGEAVYEVGWSVAPEHHGRGIATAATAQALAGARAAGGHRYVHAYPSVDNAPSNAICRKLGFTLIGAFDGEYPPGHPLRVNDWRLDLRPGDPHTDR